jgi:hypothetical protein
MNNGETTIGPGSRRLRGDPRAHGTDVAPRADGGMWRRPIWIRLHGLVTLEIEGNFTSMGADPRLIVESEQEDLLNPLWLAEST